MKTILDVSSLVYGGHYGSPDRRISGFPIGGIRKVLGIINAQLPTTDFILCFDSGVSFRKELLPEYKAGRVPNYSVFAQLDLLQEILSDCGIPFYSVDGLEADDLICSVVHFLGSVGDFEQTVIYTDDRDLACCVNSYTCVKNATSNGICIDRENYERRVVNGTSIPYNTILLYKMMCGDKSDNYGALNIPSLRFIELANFLNNELTPYLERKDMPEVSYMNAEVIKVLIDDLPASVSEESREVLRKRVPIVFPRFTDITINGEANFMSDARASNDAFFKVIQRHLKIFCQGGFNTRRFNMYCNILGLNRCRMDRLSLSDSDQVEEFKGKLRLMAAELSNGAYAVGRQRLHASRKPQTYSAIQNMTLPI